MATTKEKTYDSDGFSEEDDTPETFLDYQYKQAVAHIRKNANKIAKEHLIYFYARYKFIVDGECNTSRPGGMLNFEAKTKWDSWKKLTSDFPNLTKEMAKEQYCSKLSIVMPDWDKNLSEKDEFEAANDNGTFGIKMSAMTSDEQFLAETEKTCFDYVKEESLDKLKNFLKKLDNRTEMYKESLNQRDDEKMTLLMWACDRGSYEIVKFLVDSGADINLQDVDGQSCLHYAVSCEHVDIIKFLLQNKNMNRDLEDSDGVVALDSTDNKEIKDLFV